MKIAVNIARIIVGLLFIFSGLVKANDPLGLSYKMQEFFEVWGLHGFNSITLPMSVFMNAFEIIAGTALLIGWRIRLFSWLLLLLIVFFTFLTGYTYVTGKPTNCGCFGDCLPLTSKSSFLKDIFLLILIGLIFWKQKFIKPFLSEKLNIIKMVSVTIFSFGLQWYTLTYLPIVDCLPFKKGNNISEKMKVPANAIPDSTVITFVYNKNGQEVEFTADKFPADFNSTDYSLVKRYDRVIRKGKNNEPPIKGFSLSGPTNEDSTEIVLSQPYAVLLFCEKFSVSPKKWKADFEEVYKLATLKHIPVYMITAAPGEALEVIEGTGFSDIQIFKCDYKAIATAARTDPCLFFLKKGTVLGKWSYHRMGNVIPNINNIQESEMLPPPPPKMPEDTIVEDSTTMEQ
ncbi:MAG: DoxX family protein [Chitinophagales bacterium]|nr:DoxX family protein [Chitinophagales bacterium]